MMERLDISQDDLLDVAELSMKIETFVNQVLEDTELNVAFSSLMSGSINSLLARCQNKGEVLFYGNLFIQIIDNTMRTVITSKFYDHQ